MEMIRRGGFETRPYKAPIEVKDVENTIFV